MNKRLVKIIQNHIATASIGPSALRNQGAPGVVKIAQDFCKALDINIFAKSGANGFEGLLNELTEDLKDSFPKRARSWGAARKAINLFLRNCFYNVYLNKGYSLHRLEDCLEIPLDSAVARGLKKRDHKRVLPKWPGLKNLTIDASNQYQGFTKLQANEEGIARVHLDARLWVEERKK